MFSRTPGYEDMELSTQILIREAMARNVMVEVLDRKDNFIRLKRDSHVEYIKQATRTSADNYIVPLIMENKIVTKKLLEEKGIVTPRGEDFSDKETCLGAFSRFKEKNIVVKPNSTNFGIGITILRAPYSEASYRLAVDFAFDNDSSVLVEEFMEGMEYRFLVIGGKVLAILHRVPANVKGDGKSTIRQLVEEKNRDPLRGKGYVTPLEKLSLGEPEKEFLASQQKDFDYIPCQGETVFLRKNSNISTGGDSIDYTDTIPEGYKEIAARSVEAVGAKICGLDMIIRDYNQEPDNTNYTIIELNFNPALHIHAYPYIGKNRGGEKAVLDLLGYE